MVLKEQRDYIKIIVMKTESAIAHQGSRGFDWMGNVGAIPPLKVVLFSLVHFLSLFDFGSLCCFSSLPLFSFLSLISSLPAFGSHAQQTRNRTCQ